MVLEAAAIPPVEQSGRMDLPTSMSEHLFDILNFVLPCQSNNRYLVNMSLILQFNWMPV